VNSTLLNLYFFAWRDNLNRSTFAARIEFLGYCCRVAFNWEGPDSGWPTTAPRLQEDWSSRPVPSLLLRYWGL